MKSLNRMIAEFGRGKDRKKRKKHGYGMAALKGAGIGALAIPGAVGVKESLTNPRAAKSASDAINSGARAGSFVGGIGKAVSGNATGIADDVVMGAYRGAGLNYGANVVGRGLSVLGSKGVLVPALATGAALGAGAGLAVKARQNQIKDGKSISGRLKRLVGK